MKETSHFFDEPVFNILAQELWQRYYRQENFGQSIGMQLFEEVDTEALRRLLGILPNDWLKMKRLTISKLDQALKESTFGWDISEFVQFVTQKEFLIKEKMLAEEDARFKQFCIAVTAINPIFIEELTKEQQWRWFKKESNDLTIFIQVSHALQGLPKEYMRMPVFAYQQTGDAHAFDEGKQAGQLLLQMLANLSETAPMPDSLAPTERKHQLLAEFYLLRDDSKNAVSARGLVATRAGAKNEMWWQSCLEDCSWNIPLREILRMEDIYPFSGSQVLVVENSGVYSILLDYFPQLPIVCSSGQFTYAVWQLLRKLVQSGNQLYYVGDLDPEGLVMAQRLLKLFPEQAQIIGMNVPNYQRAVTHEKISQQRLKQLRLITEPTLKQVADKINESSRIALQEGFIEPLIQEVSVKFHI